MKRIFSSVFVVLILFNVIGYYGVFLGMQYQHTRSMIRTFNDGTYDPQQTAVIKIPFKANPDYYSETFTRVDGDFEMDGEVYRIIKSRLFRDTFHIVYMKDKTGTAINRALADYVKTFIENTPDHGSITVKPFFVKEYFSHAFSLECFSGWEDTVRHESALPVFIETFTTSVVHPPERG